MGLLDVNRKPIKIVMNTKYVCVKTIAPTTFYKVGTVILPITHHNFTNRLPENFNGKTLRISDGVGGFDGLWAIYAPTFNESLEEWM